MKKPALRGLCAALLCAVLAGCAPADQPLFTPSPSGAPAQGQGETAEASAQPEQPFSLTLCLGDQAPKSLDPNLSAGLDSHSYLLHLYEGLYRYDEEGKVRPGVALDSQASQDGLTWTIRLREDACWTDGRPVRAEDFVYSLRRLADPETGALYGYDMALYFENGEAVALGELPPEALGVTALSDTELELRLSQPCAFLEEVLAHPCLVPLREDQPLDGSCTCGPYRLKEMDEDALVLERNPSYTGEASALAEELRFVFGREAAMVGLSSGQVDFVLERQATEDAEGVVNASCPRTGSRVLVFQQQGPLGDEALRRALYLTVDQEKAAQSLADGSLAAKALVGPGVLAPDGTDFYSEGGAYILGSAQERRAQAEALLAQARLPEEPLRLLVYGDEKILRLATGIAEDWQAALKVEVQLETPGFMAFFDEYFAGNFDVALWSSVPDFASPLLLLQDFETDGYANCLGFSNAAFDGLVEQARPLGMASLEGRQAMHQAEELLLEESAVCPLTHYATLYAKREALQGETILHSGLVLFGGARCS